MTAGYAASVADPEPGKVPEAAPVAPLRSAHHPTPGESTMNRSTTLLLGAALATTVLVACGDDAKSGSSDGDYCARIAAYHAKADGLDAVFESTRPTRPRWRTPSPRCSRWCNDLKDGAPAEIKADVSTMSRRHRQRRRHLRPVRLGLHAARRGSRVRTAAGRPRRPRDAGSERPPHRVLRDHLRHRVGELSPRHATPRAHHHRRTARVRCL